MFYIMLDDISSISHKLEISRRPSIPAPKRNYREYDIPGRDGLLYEDLKTFDDIVISIEFNYVDNPNRWHHRWRKAKQWLLLGGMRKLKFSDDLDYYYIVKKVEIEENDRQIVEGGMFTANFTIAPYEYLVDGLLDIKMTNGYLFNQFEWCEPIYKIVGEGMCTLNVNGNEMIANVGQNITIDISKKLAYRNDGMLMNTSVNGDFDNMILQNGNNTISITDGFSLTIIPNWRCI